MIQHAQVGSLRGTGLNVFPTLGELLTGRRQPPAGLSPALGLAGKPNCMSSASWDVGARDTVTQPLSLASFAEGQPGAQSGIAPQHDDGGADALSATTGSNGTSAATSVSESSQQLLQAAYPDTGTLCGYSQHQRHGHRQHKEQPAAASHICCPAALRPWSWQRSCVAAELSACPTQPHSLCHSEGHRKCERGPAQQQHREPETLPAASRMCSQSRNAGRKAEHQPAALAAGVKGSLNGKSLGLPKKVLGKASAPPDRQDQDSGAAKEELPGWSSKQPCSSQGRPPVQAVAVDQETSQQLVEHQEMTQILDVAMAKEKEEQEEDIDKVSQVKVITAHNLWVNPSVPELLQDPQGDIQEGSGCPSSKGIGATGEATGELQSMSPVPAGPTDTKLAASTLARAAEEEEHCANLTAVAQEEAAPAPASPVCEEMASNITGQVLIASLAVVQGTSQQLVEHQEMTQILDVAMAKRRKSKKDIDKVLSQVKVIAVHNLWVNPSVPELLQDPQGISREGSGCPSSKGIGATGELQSMSPVPAGPTDTKLAASTLARAAEEEENCANLTPVAQEEAAPAPASPVCGNQPAAGGTSGDDPNPGCDKWPKRRKSKKRTLIKCLSQVKVIAVHNLWVNPSVPELLQDPQGDIQEGSGCPSSKGIGATGELQSMSPVPAGPTDTKLAASTLARAAEEEEHCANLTAVAQEEAAPAPASPVCGTGLDTQRRASLPWLLGSSVNRELQQQESKGRHLPPRQRWRPGRRQEPRETMGEEADDEELDKKEEEEWEEEVEKELFEGEEITTSSIWVNPLVPELLQDPHADPQEGSSCPSSVGIDATGEATSDLQSMSAVLAAPTDTKVAASTLARAAEAEEYGAHLTPVAQEEEAPAQSQAPALLSPQAYEMILEEMASNITGQVLITSLVVVWGSSQQLVKHREMAQLLGVAMAVVTSAEAGDTESPMSGDHQGEASTALVSRKAQEDEVTASLPQKAAAEAGAPRFAPGASDEGDAAATPSAWASCHPLSEVPVASTGDTEVLEAGAAPGVCVAGRFPLVPMPEPLEEVERSSMAHTRHRLDTQRRASLPWLLGSSVNRELQQQESKGRHLTPRQRWRPGRRPEVPGTSGEEADDEGDEDQDKEEELSEGEEIATSNIWVNPLVLELFEDPHVDSQEGSSCPSSTGMDATGEATGDLQSMSPASAGSMDTESAASALASAAEEEEHCAPLTPVAQEEEAPAPASLGVGEQEAAPQAQSQALATLSPDVHELVAQEAALLITTEPPVQAVDQGTSQQLVEYQDMTQILDVTMAALAPAALEDIESAVALEPQGEASAAVASPEALEDEMAASLAPIPATEAGTSHVPPGADDSGDAAASPLSQDSQRQGTVRHFVRKDLAKVVTVVRGTSQQQVEEPDVAQSLDVESPAMSPAVVRDTEDKPGIAALPDTGAAPQQRPSRFRRVLKALRRAFRCSCMTPQVEE
ncbi:uncharacterized protein LOC115614844 [Strigops habroptila]|uniref:uncharacterized protein LOC115614844 n=1 Tax=Strigops habroptila TaxID=2489341 RepID=UPI0011CF64B7|nr:uncharacterized protein LOC115614844 [Strigops habroptila]